MPVTRTHLTVIETARILGMHRRTVHRQIKAGKILAIKLPAVTGAYLIPKKVVDQLLAEKQAGLPHAS